MKTAVEYIKEKLMCDEYWYEKMTFEEIFEKAEEIFEEQIKNAWLEGNSTECDADGFAQRIEMEQYYNETFKSE